MKDDNPKEFCFHGEPVARMTKALRSLKQLTAIRSIANKLRIDAGEVCQALMKCNVIDLTVWAASVLIGWLKSDYFKSAVVVTCVGCNAVMHPQSKSRLCLYCVLEGLVAA